MRSMYDILFRVNLRNGSRPKKMLVKLEAIDRSP